jgi:hypothetical protein
MDVLVWEGQNYYWPVALRSRNATGHGRTLLCPSPAPPDDTLGGTGFIAGGSTGVGFLAEPWRAMISYAPRSARSSFAVV